MNRHDQPAHPDLAAPGESPAEDSVDDLFTEDFSAEEWDASHLPRFSA